jgi:exosortase
MSLMTLGVMIAYFLPHRTWIRATFVLTTVPIALVANAFRIAGTGMLGRWFGEAAAQGFFHTFSGWLIFVLAFATLMLEVTMLMRFIPYEAKGSR